MCKCPPVSNTSVSVDLWMNVGETGAECRSASFSHNNKNDLSSNVTSFRKRLCTFWGILWESFFNACISDTEVYHMLFSS